MSKLNLPKHLFLLPIFLLCFGIANSQIFSESFDGTTFEPAGWVNIHSGGANTLAIWSRGTAGSLVGDDGVSEYVYLDPHTGAGMAQFTSYDFQAGNGAYLASPAVDLSSATPKIVSFWMYRDSYYQARLDSVSVYLNSAQNLTGAKFIGKVIRAKTAAPVQAGADGWYKYSFVIPASLNLSNSYLIFKAMSDYGNNISIDDVSIDNNLTCTGTPTGGTASTDVSILCSAGTVNLSLGGASTNDGIVYQWESAPAGSTAFTSIAGADGLTYQATITASTDYRAKVLCSSSNLFVYSSIVSVELGGIPANDEACGAIVLTDGGAPHCGNTTCATSDANDPNSTCSTPNNTVWYKFTAPANGPYDIKVERPASGTDYLDAWVDIFTASGSCPSLTYTVFSTDCLEADLPNDETAIITTPALTAGTDYYIRLDGVLGAIGSYCISISQPPLPPACTNNIAPANAAVVTQSPVVFTWNAVPGATNYTLFVGTTNPLDPIADSILDVSDTTVGLIGFSPNTTYYWYVTPKNSGGGSTGCAASLTSFSTVGPTNDACSNAVPLTVSNGFCASPVLGTLALADTTVGLTAPACSPSALRNDVWYQVVIPATGNVTVQTSAVNTITTDLVIEAYSGSCGALTAIGCDDDGNPDPTPSSLHSRLGITGRAAGEVIYIRVMPYISSGTTDNQGAFAICAFDTTASVMPPISRTLGASNCTDASPINIDSAFKYTWVTFKEIGSSAIIASIYPNGNKLGVTNVSFYQNTSGNVRVNGSDYYLDRNVTITPATQPTSQVTNRLYFTESELAALSAATGGATRTDLNSTKTSQTCPNAAAIAPGGTFIAQSGNGAYLEDHYVDVQSNAYSTFYLHKGTTVVPVTLAAFNAQRTGRVNTITWSTAQELDIRMYVIERSTDGRNYTGIGQQLAIGGSAMHDYSFLDMTPAKGINYYRLRVMDADGRIKYSNVKNVRNEGTADVALYPNPVRDLLRININSDVSDKASLTISDMNGRLVYSNNLRIIEGANYSDINVGNISNGTYVIKIQLNNDMVIRKFNKL